MKNRKQGFTLVELMTVIIILGVLAAIGVPKLGASIAKSKAAELSPAAGTYIKLQDAYVISEKKIGSWKRIGFQKPKSTNFNYGKGTITRKMRVDELASGGNVGLEATSLVRMGGCDAGNKWTVTVLKKGVDEQGNITLEYKSEVIRSTTSDYCVSLASGWGIADGVQQLAGASSSTSETPGDDSHDLPDPSEESPTFSSSSINSAGASSSSQSTVTLASCTSEHGQSFWNGAKVGQQGSGCMALRRELFLKGEIVCSDKKSGGAHDEKAYNECTGFAPKN